ncbi:FAD:protein FMN transferase [Rhabdochromatium marinum]|uniref:FAD:protein FMN transferase n=1 Tax=Rhabdochromatium marinum TaxID=48729 RepID=UPI0030845241
MTIWLLSACGDRDQTEVVELYGRTMGTTYSVQIVNPPPDFAAQTVQQQLDAELADINAQMSTYDPNSSLSQFNQSGVGAEAAEAGDFGDWFPVPVALAQVVEEAQQISRLSHGAFDITVGRLVNLWGFGPEFHPDQVPTDEAIAKALRLTGYHKLAVRLQPPALRKALPELYVDLSAIAKGYAVDQLAERLQQLGLDNYLVEVGGELRAAGPGPGRPWRIAIERPESQARDVFRVVSLHDIGMATSGDYRNFFETDGMLYSHTINPHTGRPVTHHLASVTVLDKACMRADALATALLALGPHDGLQLAEAQDIPAFFIERQATGYQAQMTRAFERLTAPAP